MFVADIWSGPCRFGIFGSVSISVEDIDVPDQSPGEGVPCGRLGLIRDLMDSKEDVV